MAGVLLLAPHLPTPDSTTTFRIAAYASHAVWYALLMLVVLQVTANWALPIRALLGAVAASFVLVAVLNVLDLDVASDLAKVVFGALAGTAFVRAIERPWWLIPICITVPIADAWSVFSERGVTNAVVERAQQEPRWIDWPTIATPIAGLPYDLFGRLGIVDVLFAALFVGAATRWQLGRIRTAVALALGLVATSVLVIEGADVAIPALPLLCIAFLIACARPLVRDARAALLASRE